MPVGLESTKEIYEFGLDAFIEPICRTRKRDSKKLPSSITNNDSKLKVK